MFPIPFNIPFRKKDGSLSTLGDELNNGGGGSSYTLPTASADTKGGVKIGVGLIMDGEVLKNTNPTPPAPYTLPIASDETLGGVKVGNGLSIGDDGTLSTSGGGGGTSLYYKTITANELTSSTVTKRRTIKDSNNVETCFYEVSKNLINQSGYIPIACIVGDNYTGYYSNGAVMKSGNDYVVVIVTTYASTAYNEFAPLTVIYVPETGLTELT